MKRSLSDITNAWYASYDKVVSFGAALVDAGWFRRELNRGDEGIEAQNLLAYFEKPWHWDREHAWWVAMGMPDDAETWEIGDDMKWEIPSLWVIRSDRFDQDDGALFWKHDFGWVPRSSATVYKTEERTTILDGHWVPLLPCRECGETTELPLSDLGTCPSCVADWIASRV